MLELTRRMTLKRNCFSRIAGAYMDEEGYVDGTFNIHFLKLTPAERTRHLKLAKAVPFAETNKLLKEHVFSSEQKRPGKMWQFLRGIKESELKNDALLDVFYEWMGERCAKGTPYAIYLFFGTYDVPLKATDGEALWESEEVYQFLICTVCPVHGDYEAEMPVQGFLFPAFKDRSEDVNRINLYDREGQRPGMAEILFCE